MQTWRCRNQRGVERSGGDMSPATRPEVVFAAGYFFAPVACPLSLARPPLYESILDFRCANSSSLRSTIVPEVFDASSQPIRGSCEPMNRVRSRMRACGKRALRMLSPPRTNLGERIHPRGDRVNGVCSHPGDECTRRIYEALQKRK